MERSERFAGYARCRADAYIVDEVDWWKTHNGDRPCFPSNSKVDAPAKMSEASRFFSNRGNPLYCERSCRDLKSRVTLDSLNTGSPLQSSWIQRITPASLSLGADQLQNTSVRTGDRGLSYLHSRRETLTASSSHRRVPVKQLEGLPHKNSCASTFRFVDRQRQQTGNGFSANSCDIYHAASEEPPVVLPEAQVCPIQLPTVESLLPGYSKKGNEKKSSFTSAGTGSPAAFITSSKPSDGKRQSNEMTQCSYYPSHTKTGGLGPLSAEKFKPFGSKSLLFQDRHKSVYNAENRGEYLLSKARGRLSGRSPGTTNNLGASAVENENLHDWKSQLSEHNNGSKSDACASNVRGNACTIEGLGTGMVKATPPHDIDVSAQICDVKCAKSVLGSVMPDRCFQLESSDSRVFQCEQFGTSVFNLKDIHKKSDVETAVIEWPFPFAAPIKDNTQQHSGSSSSAHGLSPELSADLLLMNKLTETHCSRVISEQRNGGEVMSAIDFTRPRLHSLEMDGLSEGDSASYQHSHKKLRVDDVLSNRVTHCYFKSATDAHGHEIERTVFKEPQQQKINLISGVGVLSRPESRTGSRWAEDEQLEYIYALENLSKHNNLVAYSHLKPSTDRSEESEPKNSFFVQRLPNSSSADAKLQAAGGDKRLLRGDGINTGHLVKSCRPAAVDGHFNRIQIEMHADRHSKVKSVEYENVPSAVLGKRSRVVRKELAESVLHVASDPVGSDANRSNVCLNKFHSKPKMWIKRWCPATSMKTTQYSSVLDKEFRIAARSNDKSQHYKPFRGLGDAVDHNSRGNAYWETPEIFGSTHSEKHERRCKVLHETNEVVSGLDLEAIRRQYHVDRRHSHFMKRFFTPSAAAMAIIGTTAQQIHAKQPQKKGLFGFWSSPKDHTMRASEPQDAAFDAVGSKPKFMKGVMLSAEYPVTLVYA